MEPTPPAKQLVYQLLLLTFVCAATFFFGIGRLALVGPDEPRYAEVAREMFVSGDYVSPRLCGYLWFEKPALAYWLSALTYRILGVNELAARLPSALLAWGTVLLLFVLLRRAGDVRLAFSAATVLATSGIFIAYSRVVTPDMCLTAAMTLALMTAHAALDVSGRASRRLWWLCGAATGLAVLAKGLVGLVLIGAILLVYLAATSKWKSVNATDVAVAVAGCLLVASTWYLPVMLRHGRGFAVAFFIRHHFDRFTTNVYGHPQPFYFFFVVAILGMFPWSFFLVPAAARLKSLRTQGEKDGSLILFAWIWIAIPLLFFSFSGSKLPGYLLPIFPAIAIVVGNEVAIIKTPAINLVQRAAILLTAILLAATAVAFPLYLRHEGADTSGWKLAVVATTCACSLVAAVFVAARRELLAPAVITVIVIVIASVLLLFPILNERRSLKSLTVRAAANLKPGERICYYITKEFAAVFYAQGRVVCVPDPVTGEGQVLNALREDILARALEENDGSLVVITTSNWLPGLQSDARFGLEYLAEQGDALALRVRLRERVRDER